MAPAAPARSASSTGLSAAPAAAARPRVEPTTLARWSRAMSDVAADAGGERAADTPTAALSLRELRARHAADRHAHDDGLRQPEAGSTSRAAAAPEPRGEPLLVAARPAAIAADHSAAPGGGSTEPLHALIESCCSRLWVSDRGDAAAPRGVMLDLGGWMPGCTLEVARAAGTLRIVLRGVHDEWRERLERELHGLSAGLAETLGCAVVTAVEARGAMR